MVNIQDNGNIHHIDIRVHGKRDFELRSSFHFAGVTVPKGFRFDGASVPRVFWWLLPPIAGGAAIAACWHDWLYRDTNGTHGFDRAFVDAGFRTLLHKAAVRLPRRWLAWLAVRAFGWLAYKKKDQSC